MEEEKIKKNKYSRGKIYKIVDNTNGKIYIGSSCEVYLSQRLSKHNNKYKRKINGLTNENLAVFEVIENGDYTMVLIEKYPCESKEELFARERYHIERNECVNKVIPGRTRKETVHAYYVSNKEKIDVTTKKWSEDNKEKRCEISKRYRSNNKEALIKPIDCACGGRYQTWGKHKHLKTKMHIAYFNL